MCAILFESCGPSESNKSNAKAEVETEILDIKLLLNKSAEEVVEVLGSIDKREPYTGYPCENSSCEKVFYNQEKYEILFKDGKTERITINSVPDLTNDENAIQQLGLKQVEPSFQNIGTVIRYNDVEGIHEINFNYDFIYVMVNPVD